MTVSAGFRSRLAMSLILRRSLTFILLMIAGLVMYALWFDMRADRFDETAVPYLQTALPGLTSWRYEKLKPLLSPSARLDFENEKVKAAYHGFNRLGDLESMEKPQYLANSSGTSKALGDVEIIDYQVDVQFASGPAVIKLTLIADDESRYIHHFSIQSEIFTAE